MFLFTQIALPDFAVHILAVGLVIGMEVDFERHLCGCGHGFPRLFCYQNDIRCSSPGKAYLVRFLALTGLEGRFAPTEYAHPTPTRRMGHPLCFGELPDALERPGLLLGELPGPPRVMATAGSIGVRW